MKYYLIAGEASGDLHGSNLLKSLSALDASAEFRGWGGDRMEQSGMKLVKHYRELAFMGFTEVILNLGTILRNLKSCKKDIEAFSPDVLILVDYPGFNLRIARWAKSKGIRVFYYISPQIWAWKESRINIIKSSVDRMFVILPFEKEFYKKHHVNVDFVGHPLLDEIRNAGSVSGEIIALLPGSRIQEIKAMLPLMLKASAGFKKHKIAIACAPSVPEKVYLDLLGPADHVELVKNKTYDLLRRSAAALVTSGTATLEAALLDVPQVVCYRGGTVSYMLAKLLVRIKYISLVNLIMDKEVVKELIQSNLTPARMQAELGNVLEGPARDKMLLDYSELKNRLGGAGASAKAASLMYKYLIN